MNSNEVMEYADKLFCEKKYVDSKELYLKGAEMGNYSCMIKYCHLAIMVSEATIIMIPKESYNCILELKEAEKWAKKLKEDGFYPDNDILAGRYGIYNELTWCYFLEAIQSDNKEFYRYVVDTYLLIKEKPTSRTTYAFIQSLEELGLEEEAFRKASRLVKDYDETLEEYMLEVLYAFLAKSYFIGLLGKPNYQYAKECVDMLAIYNPNSELVCYFKSGEAKADFNKMCMKKDASIKGSSIKKKRFSFF